MNNWESIEAIHGKLYNTMDEAHAAYIAATYTVGYGNGEASYLDEMLFTVKIGNGEAEYLDEMGIHGEARQDWQRRQHAKENN